MRSLVSLRSARARANRTAPRLTAQVVGGSERGQRNISQTTVCNPQKCSCNAMRCPPHHGGTPCICVYATFAEHRVDGGHLFFVSTAWFPVSVCFQTLSPLHPSNLLTYFLQSAVPRKQPRRVPTIPRNMAGILLRTDPGTATPSMGEGFTHIRTHPRTHARVHAHQGAMCSEELWLRVSESGGAFVYDILS